MRGEGTPKPRSLKVMQEALTHMSPKSPKAYPTQPKENNKFLIRDTGECVTCMYEREYSHSIQIMRTICFPKRYKILQLEGDQPSIKSRLLS